MPTEKAPENLPHMALCDSSMIHSFGYDPQLKQLFVRFHHGRKLWRYPNFPPDLFQTMKTSPSPGKFFLQRVSKVYEGTYVREDG